MILKQVPINRYKFAFRFFVSNNIFFRKDLFDLKNNQKLLKLIIIGSIPLIIFGYILHSTELIHLLRNIKVIAWTTLFFGIILYFADQKKLIRIFPQI